MRIIAKQSDYYDHIQSYGMDPGVVYTREPRVIGTAALSKSIREDLCGKCHRLYLPREYRRGIPLPSVNIVVAGHHYRFYYLLKEGVDAPDSVNKFTLGQSYDVFDSFKEARREYKSYYFMEGEPDYFDQGNLKYYDYAKENNAPLIIGGISLNHSYKDGDKAIDTNGRVCNVSLDETAGLIINAPVLQFMGLNHIKGFDPHEVFMKISTFVAGINTTDMVEINDKSKIVKSGFDIKESFRHRK